MNPRLNKQSKFNFRKIVVQLRRATYTFKKIWGQMSGNFKELSLTCSNESIWKGLNPRLNKQSKFNLIKILAQSCRATYTLVQRNMRSNVSRFWGAKLDLLKWTLAANIHISVDWCHTSTLLGGKNNFHYPDFAQSFMSIFGVLQYVLCICIWRQHVRLFEEQNQEML